MSTSPTTCTACSGWNAGGRPSTGADHQGRPWELGALPDERTASASAFLERALAWFARHGITVELIMADNGSAYRSHGFRNACTCAGVRYLRTKPYTSPTNGKAERFLRECATARRPDRPGSAPLLCPAGGT